MTKLKRSKYDWRQVIENSKSCQTDYSNVLDLVDRGYYREREDYLSPDWIDIAICLERLKTVEVILDIFKIPKENMTLKERLSYFYLFEEIEE